MENELGPADLAAYLAEYKITGEILQLKVPTPTVEAAAQAVSSQPEQIVKSILFLVDEQPCLTIACGKNTISKRALADYFGVGRKRVKLAEPETVIEQTGYAVGAMPPFGHKTPVLTLIDKPVLEQPLVFAGGGSNSTLLHLSSQTILEVTKGVVLDLTNEGVSNQAKLENTMQPSMDKRV